VFFPHELSWIAASKAGARIAVMSDFDLIARMLEQNTKNVIV
jgi:hypothetical protein